MSLTQEELAMLASGTGTAPEVASACGVSEDAVTICTDEVTVPGTGGEGDLIILSGCNQRTHRCGVQRIDQGAIVIEP